MIRRSPALALLLSAVAAATVASAYGCGGADDGAGSSSGDAAEGGVTLVDGAAPLPDGAATLPDGAVVSPTDAGTTDAGATDGAAADAGHDSGADAGVDAAPPPPPPGPLSPDYVDYEINHILSTGQSNSTANSASPYLSNTQPYGNIMFNTGTMAGSNPTSFVPLVEGDNGVETISSGLANRVSKFALETFEFGVKADYPTKHDILVSNHGRSGWSYWCLRKGGCTYKPAAQLAFPEAIAQVTKAKQLADAAGKSYVVRAVTTIHGESDHTGYVVGTPEFPLDGSDGTFQKIKDYSDALLEWQEDYEAMVKGITGQAQGVPLFVSQISGWNNSRYSQIAQFQYLAHKRAPGKVILIGASYPLQFRTDCLHFTAESQRRLGEYFAKVYAKVILAGETWEPVRPMQITRAANVITVQYYVPAPPLVLDTTRVTNPGQYGFEYVDDNGPIAITNVVVSGADTVTVTLASTPTGANKKLRYGQNQIPSTCVGPGTIMAGGARGNVRDSDATPSRHGYDLHNWGVIFDEAVP